MKRFLLSAIASFILIAPAVNSIHAQNADTLKRTVGFFFSPAATGVHDLREYPALNAKMDFGLTGGFRTTYSIGHGFFLEGGFTLSSCEWKYKEPNYYWLYDYYGGYTYMAPQRDVTEKFISISTPFLAGYRTTKGAVRFVGQLGFSFNLQLLSIKKYEDDGNLGYYAEGNHVDIAFRPNLGVMARAGISLPFAKGRCSIDLLPTARYSTITFHSGKMDMLQTVTSDFRPWSLGLDVGFSLKINDKKKVTYEHQDYGQSYTFAPGGDSTVKEKPRSDYFRNFVYIEMAGNGGIYSTNYERTVYHGRKIGLNARAGFGILPEHYAFPIGVNLTIGDTPRKFEIGLGTTFENFTQNGKFGESGDFNMNVVPSMGIRIESQHHFFFRASVMAHYIMTSSELWPGIGFAFGGAF
ncbi:MAG: hypothetical protein WCM76_10780 [Bacteroidota bacterium]